MPEMIRGVFPQLAISKFQDMASLIQSPPPFFFFFFQLRCCSQVQKHQEARDRVTQSSSQRQACREIVIDLSTCMAPHAQAMHQSK